MERKASSESEVISLREQLQQEKLQKLLNGQAVTNLQEKVSSLEEQKSGLEAQLKEKQNTLLDSETNAREQKNKAQKSKDKVPNIIIIQSCTLFQYTYELYLYSYSYVYALVHGLISLQGRSGFGLTMHFYSKPHPFKLTMHVHNHCCLRIPWMSSDLFKDLLTAQGQ